MTNLLQPALLGIANSKIPSFICGLLESNHRQAATECLLLLFRRPDYFLLLDPDLFAQVVAWGNQEVAAAVSLYIKRF